MSAHARPEIEPTAEAYRRFAEVEAKGRSPLYQELACRIADDGDVMRFLMALPREKRQPNLLFAAVRSLCGTAANWADFRARLLGNQDGLRQLMMRRSTQTNEPARCAVLLPLLARLPQPLALIEVGASAGLCLLPDRYGYDYGGVRLPADPGAPTFSCRAGPQVPLPVGRPRIAWRRGLDLHPLSVDNADDRGWLEALVWPEQVDRLARLKAAMTIARAGSPTVVQGDLRRDLAAVVAAAPPDTTIVIMHTAVLGYVASLADREAFAAEAMRLADYWIANEAARVFPAIARRAARPGEGFLLSVNGEPVAWTDPHGAALDWLA